MPEHCPRHSDVNSVGWALRHFTASQAIPVGGQSQEPLPLSDLIGREDIIGNTVETDQVREEMPSGSEAVGVKETLRILNMVP